MGQNIHPLSAIFKPLDYVVNVLNMGRDASQVAADFLLGLTPLSSLQAEAPPPPPPPAPAPAPEQKLTVNELFVQAVKTFQGAMTLSEPARGEVLKSVRATFDDILTNAPHSSAAAAILDESIPNVDFELLPRSALAAALPPELPVPPGLYALNPARF